ncbi:glycosyltransferase family 39 protein [Achromobacter deleyi]|uniref:glycosyltransferase family 39 protein n=1 Tax=Achromobacter deleyi TaxID=1353891 RepID=UPI00149241E8|nr:glycosyltransferase family 39 protein [Achromobacter deleyi]QVQ29250.1 glycosyltransferase family 39 protein [Achromobacter deleyi]UIP19371.1 glycosyltransferase family 39 protein [Achromobacter deleyi]
MSLVSASQRAGRVGSVSQSTEVAGSRWKIEALFIPIVALAALWSCYWLLDPRNFFKADDWAWLGFSAFEDIGDFLNILPRALYNDRPVGALFIRGMHHLVGLNYPVFQAVLLLLHAANSVMLYLIACRYMPRKGAFVAAILSATWFVALNAVGWVAAIFDLLGATLCLLGVLLRQQALRRGGDWRWNIAGALAYLLAFRTKEYAIGLVAVLFLMELLCERRRIRQILLGLAPYIGIFVVYMASYFWIYVQMTIPADDPYKPHFSMIDVVSNLWRYIENMFFPEIVGRWALVAVVLGLVPVAVLTAWRRNGAAMWGLASFAILLGPTLLLSNHLDNLYLYAPHFFMAIAIGAGFAAGWVGRLIALALAIFVLLAPVVSGQRTVIANFTLGKTEVIQSQYQFAMEKLAGAEDNTTVVVSGVEPYFNLFSYGPGDALNIAVWQKKFKLVVEKPMEDLDRAFCEASGAKRFFHFDGTTGTDITAEKMEKCATLTK